MLAAGEVRGDAFADRARLADVEQLAVLPVEEVDARRVGQLAALLGDPLGAREAAVFASSSAIGQRVGSWPLGQTQRPRDGERDDAPRPLSPPELNTLRIEIDGEIGTLTLDRPDAFNAMSPEMIGELTVAFAWLADRAPLRALIVTGAGKAFCAGGDVTWFRKGVEAEEIDLPSEVRRGAEALHAGDRRPAADPLPGDRRGQRSRRPGPASRWPSPATSGSPPESAFFACAYGRIGASPDGGMTYFLPRVVGPEPSPGDCCSRTPT